MHWLSRWDVALMSCIGSSVCLRSMCFFRFLLLMRILQTGHLFLITGLTQTLPEKTAGVVGTAVVGDGVVRTAVVGDGFPLTAGVVSTAVVEDGVPLTAGVVNAAVVGDGIVAEVGGGFFLQTCTCFSKSPLFKIVVSQYGQW